MDHSQKPPAILSICTGMRGIENGLHRAIGPINVIAYVEIEAFIIENLCALMEAGVVDAAPIWSDIKTFNGGPFHGRIHGIVAGYPCQGESTAGNQKGTSDERWIWPDIERAIQTIKPFWCFFENVAGHLELSFPIVFTSLRNMGFRVEAGLYSAAEVGAPHTRKRLFILAIRDGITNSTTLGIARAHSKNMANTNGDVFPGRLEHGTDQSQASRSESPDKEKGRTHRQRVWPEFSPSGESHMANPGINRGATGLPKQEPRQERHARIINHGGIEHQWPAKPTFQPYDFEEPRAIEPGVGCTINGYNFREDLLRMLGNGVVPQQAELAFIDLLKKHGITL